MEQEREKKDEGNDKERGEVEEFRHHEENVMENLRVEG